MDTFRHLSHGWPVYRENTHRWQKGGTSSGNVIGDRSDSYAKNRGGEPAKGSGGWGEKMLNKAVREEQRISGDPGGTYFSRWAAISWEVKSKCFLENERNPNLLTHEKVRNMAKDQKMFVLAFVSVPVVVATFFSSIFYLRFFAKGREEGREFSPLRSFCF